MKLSSENSDRGKVNGVSCSKNYCQWKQKSILKTNAYSEGSETLQIKYFEEQRGDVITLRSVVNHLRNWANQYDSVLLTGYQNYTMSKNSDTLTHFYLITSKTLNIVVKGVLNIFLGIWCLLDCASLW